MSLLVVPVPLRSASVESQRAYLAAEWANNPEDLWTDGASTALVQALSFDSACFEIPMGRVSALEIGSKGVGNAVAQLALAKGIRHLTARLPVDDIAAIQDFTSAGFYLTDTTTTFSIQLSGRQFPTKPGLLIGPVHDEEIQYMADLSADVFEKSRFFNDPFLPRSGGAKVFKQWVANNCKGRADQVLVARVDGRAVGYNSCLLTRDGALPGVGTHATIDLIAVFPEAQGRGAGRALVHAALNHYGDVASMMYVGTQGSNRAAFRLYESSGFQLEALDVTLHWHA